PLIGNYGVAADDRESRQPWIAGFIVREYYDDPSNWKSETSLAQYLQANAIPGISGVDTRALTRRLRSRGALRAALVYQADSLSDDELVARARDVTPLSDKDLVAETSIPNAYQWEGPGARGA